MQTELIFAAKLANNAVIDCENFLHNICIFDISFRTGPFTRSGNTVEKFSSAERDADPGPPANIMMTRTRGAGKQEWPY